MVEIDDLSLLKKVPVSFTLGSYDGLHAGHSVLLTELKRISAGTGTGALVISFYPHPRKVIDSGYDMRLLNTREEKVDIIASYGIDYVHFINFTKEFSMTNYSDFYKNYIFSSLSVKNIIAGTNHAFGENRKGDNRLLTELCEENSVNLTTVPPVYYGDKTISSTRIRKSLAIGDVVDASHMLGYDYFITGKVIKGKGLGSLLGFSTANTDILNSEKVIPYKGVYFTTVEFGGKTYYAVSNIGENPTLGGTGLHMETHILGFKADLYGETIKVGFIKRLRDEISFSSAVELSEAVGRDIREGMRLEKTMRMPG